MREKAGRTSQDRPAAIAAATATAARRLGKGLAGGAIKSMRVYINAQNLKTWKHNYGYTAEFGGDATAFGYDNAGGAIPVVGTAGVNITF